MMDGEWVKPSLVLGSSNLQVAGSEHAMMAQKCSGLDIWGWGERKKIKAANQEIKFQIKFITYYNLHKPKSTVNSKS